MKPAWILATSLILLATSAFADYGFLNPETQTSVNQEIIKKATAALVENEKLFSDEIPTLGSIYKFCTKENDLDQKLWSNCSGVLISKDIILTAGHCIASRKVCPDKSFVFDYKTNEDIPLIQHQKSNIYGCKKVLFWSEPVPNKRLVDFALIQLDREVIGRLPVPISSNKLNQEEDIFSYGHPLGMPLKKSVGFVSAVNAKKNVSEKNPYYLTQMLSHPGLSGAAVYNSTEQMIGLLVRGDSNFEADDGRCQRIRDCEKENCPWAEIQKLDVNLIKKYIR